MGEQEESKAQTCEQRIAEELESRMEDIRRVNRGEFEDPENPDCFRTPLDEWQENILAVTKSIVYKVELSWGGPADWFEIWQDDEGITQRIVYHFSNWFDHAEVELTGSRFEEARKVLSELLASQWF